MVNDAMNRQHQLGTIQLDFHLPSRFNLNYHSQSKELKTPVLIHRAIIGSLERTMALLIESTNGKWPFWISPRQILIISIGDSINYCKQLKNGLSEMKYHCDIDESDNTMGKKIRDAEGMGYNYVFVVGEKEVESNSVSVRERGGKMIGSLGIDQIYKFLKDHVDFN